MSFFKSKLWPLRKANVLEFEQLNAEPDAPGPNSTLVYLRSGSLRQKTESGESALGNGAGGAGEDGREIELQKTVTHIQWRYVGDVAWTNLVALADLTGPQGPAGEDGADLNLIRASGSIYGHTDPGSPPTPAHIQISFWGASQGTLHIVTGSEDRTFTFAYFDPADGSTFVDLTNAPDGPSVVALLATVIDGNLTCTTDGNTIHIFTVETGASAMISGEKSGDLSASIDPASDSGEDELSPSGALEDVTLIAGVAGKRIKIIAAGFSGSLVQSVALSNTVSGYATGGVLGNGAGILPPAGDTIGSYFNGGIGGALKFRMTGSPPVGGTCFAWVIAMQE